MFISNDNTLKLGDFGLSKALTSAAFTNTYVGTPYYMSVRCALDVSADAPSPSSSRTWRTIQSRTSGRSVV